jgi:hypothetical protein
LVVEEEEPQRDVQAHARDWYYTRPEFNEIITQQKKEKNNKTAVDLFFFLLRAQSSVRWFFLFFFFTFVGWDIRLYAYRAIYSERVRAVVLLFFVSFLSLSL